MFSSLDCYPCLVRHALEVSRWISDDSAIQRSLMRRVLHLLSRMPEEVTPVRAAAEVHALIRADLGVSDPYLAQKKKYNELALALLPRLKQVIQQAEDPLETATKIAIAGNIIDFGALGEGFDVEEAVNQGLASRFGIDEFASLRRDLDRARKVVYVGDNTGEIAFDRLLVEEIQCLFGPEITFVVRGNPILNDATLEDAREVGLADRVEVVASGGDAPGCELDRSPALQPLFESADLILSKGQGNYEALSLEPYPIYFLLRIKCKIIARDIGGEKGAGVVKRTCAYAWDR
ncbi:MAG: ARMT1-like domain-containing protein [Planctomycetota bacterium]